MSTSMTTTNHKQRREQDGNSRQALAAQRRDSERTRSTFMPHFDIWEGDEELVLYGDLPGVSAENLDIQFENRLLTIRGQVDDAEASPKYLYREYGVGDFQRVFSIGEAIDTSAVSAELHDGVLTLRLPKREAVKPRRIEVKAK